MDFYYNDFVFNIYNSDDPNSYQHIPFDYADIFTNNNECEKYLRTNKTFNLRGNDA